MSLRVLVSGVVLGQPMGGVRRHNAELLPRLARLFSEAGGELCVLEGKQPIAFALPDSVRRISSGVPAGPPLVRATLEGRTLRRVLEEARGEGRPFDLLHSAHLPLPRHLGLRHSFTVHDLRSLELLTTPMAKRLFARGIVASAVERAAVVLTVSETVRESLLGRFRLTPESVRVIPNAADHFTPLPRAVDTNPFILHVGHIEPRKNLELLVRALHAAPDLPPLRLAGAAKGGEGERLLALASELGVAQRVELTGAFDDAELPRLYAGAACVAMPSHLEGFGIPVLEAQRAGAPLCVARTSALQEVAGTEVPAFAADDVESCVNALREAIATPPAELEKRKARANRFSWDRSAHVWFEAWRTAKY